MGNIGLPPSIEKALIRISTLLASQNVEWYLRGSAGLGLQGFSCAIEDIDIETDAENGLLANQCLKKYAVVPYGPSTHGIFRDSYGWFSIKGVKVDLIQDFYIDRPPYHYHSEISAETKKRSSLIHFEGQEIRILPLEEVICGKMAKGDFEKCRRIMAQTIFQELVDLEYLKLRISQTGLDLEGAALLESYLSFDWRSLLARLD